MVPKSSLQAQEASEGEGHVGPELKYPGKFHFEQFFTMHCAFPLKLVKKEHKVRRKCEVCYDEFHKNRLFSPKLCILPIRACRCQH